VSAGIFNLRYGHDAQLPEAVNGLEPGNRSRRRAVSVQRSAALLNTTSSCGSTFRSRSGAQVDITGGHFGHHALNNAQIN